MKANILTCSINNPWFVQIQNQTKIALFQRSQARMCISASNHITNKDYCEPMSVECIFPAIGYNGPL